MRCRLTQAAEQDLADLSQHIAAADPQAAAAILELIEAKCDLLAQYPEAGRLREELLPNLRSVPVSRYVIFYRIASDEIQVIRILHGARDLPAALR
jgi:toxin ParE1/3/4